MCHRCDYEQLLRHGGVEHTPNRLRVLELIGNSDAPMRAMEIVDALNRDSAINRVTVYRILDLLVKHNLLERLSTGDRSFRYGLAPNANHRRHPHFFCKYCGQMECINPEMIHFDTRKFQQSFGGNVEKVEVRIDGICQNCMQAHSEASDKYGGRDQ